MKKTINNTVSKIESNKGVKIFGIIINLCILLFSLLFGIINLSDISELHYKQTIILPAIMCLTFFLCGIIGIIASIKINKKFFVTAISLFVISILLFFACQIVNSAIIKKDAAPAAETELEIKNYKDKCEPLLYEDLVRYPEKNKGKLIAHAGEVIEIISQDDNLSEYIIESPIKNPIYLIYPHEKKNSIQLFENDIIIFYGESEGMYDYTDTSGTVTSLPKIQARYIVVGEENLLNEIETQVPSEQSEEDTFNNAIAITYAEIELKNYLDNPKFKFTEYYNVVPPSGNNKSKIEGTVEDKNGVKHTFTMIIRFQDSKYKSYTVEYLQIDKIDYINK